MVLSKKPKFAKQLYGPLAIISDMTNNHDDTIDYGTRALAFEEIYDQPELALGVNFAISRAYFNRSLTRTDYYIALEHLNKCMELPMMIWLNCTCANAIFIWPWMNTKNC